MTTDQYIENINKRYKAGNATEHTFRGDLQQLIESLVVGIRATNEPKRQSCGAPDYILTRKDIPVGFIEAKDLGDKDLDGTKKAGNKEQFDRYKASLNNIIFTDYLHFHLYRDGQFIMSIAIAELTEKGIKALPGNFAGFEGLIREFCTHVGQTIKSSKKLAEMMAAKARLLSDVIEKALTSDDELQENSTLKDQMNAFKQVLIHDIQPKEFADVYAQTIAYGMFAARLHDPSLPTFSRQEAAELIPKSNPFLRRLFGYIAGPDLDDRIRWIVDNLVDIFLHCNVEEILRDFGKSTKMEDPIIHFYETFLSEYDPKLRKSRGVWYTPQPVVNFIVRAVDDILKTEFNLPQGLADTSKTTIKVNSTVPDNRSATGYKQTDREVHKVQILDPATGTGTFLAEVIRQIYQKFEGQQGIWSNYVEQHLLPRLNGFELLMASYAMAHLKLDRLLTETGYKPTTNQRFRVFLTNSLEEYHPDTGTLFASWLSTEANEANQIKRDTPVMCVIGNPPYSGESANKGRWIMDAMEDYKKEPGGQVKLNERNPKWINDDYVKFLRYAQHFIEKNGSGIVAFINPHGFLDNPTFRGMRWHLLKTYDKIYVLDLHGNSKKKEVSPDGSPDINVFDIMQGVSINLLIKTGRKKTDELGKVFHFGIYGKRENKYDFLLNNNFNSVTYTEIDSLFPNYFFIPKDHETFNHYNKGFMMNDLFYVNVLGFQTHRDKFAISQNIKVLQKRLYDFVDFSIEDSTIRKLYDINESNDWVIKKQRELLKNERNLASSISLTTYRPFDNQYAILNKAICDRPRKELLQHVLNRENICLLSSKQQAIEGYRHCFITKFPANDCVMSTTSREANQVFPLYIFSESGFQQTFDQSINNRTPNLNPEIIQKMSDGLQLRFTPEKEEDEGTFAPIDLLDYIYAVLHSPEYREKYKEFLKIDFPRVPYPEDVEKFWRLVALGGELRQLHLLESPKVHQFITRYPVDGDNMVQKPVCREGRVFINENQYFDGVPESAWNFYIGGYQPAQKWLKDRKGRKLEYEDILHYQRMVVALVETERVMGEVDGI